MKNRMNHVAKLALALGIALTPGVLHAQDAWPNRAITFIVPYAAGGYTDLVGRLTARYVQKELGKTIAVENRPGAGGIVETQVVASAPPDGYTFCVCSVGAASSQKGRIRSAAGFSVRGYCQFDSAGGHRQERPAGKDDGGVCILRKCQPGQPRPWLEAEPAD